MTATTTVPAKSGGARKPALSRDVAMRLAGSEYDRFLAELRSLSPEEWSLQTPCPAWDVRAMVAHVLGMAEMAASVLEQMRQMRAARRTGGLFIDALTGLQVAKHADRSSAELVRLLGETAPKAAKGRRRTPAPVRAIPMGEQPVDEAGAHMEKWTIGFLTDVILTRDVWMHRSDMAVATGREMRLTPEHDGAIVADVAREWAGRHGQPCRLVLTGPAGGEWSFGGGGGAHYELGAVEFCRILAGRGRGDGLLTTRVPF